MGWRKALFMKHAASDRRDLGAVLAIMTLALLVYSGALQNAFLVNWDDDLYVTKNPYIQCGVSTCLKTVFSRFYAGNYAPLHLLSYALDYRLWGLQPFGYIAHNVVLHGLNGVLLYFVLRQFEVSLGSALYGVLAFLLAPVQVESVAWISQRKNLLSMFWMLQCLFCYVKYTRAMQRRWIWYGFAIALFLLALLTKSITVVLPAILFAYDISCRGEKRSLRLHCYEKLPFVCLALVFGALTLISQEPEVGGVGAGMRETFLGGAGYYTFLTMLTVYRDYLYNLVWPFHLSVFYEPTLRTAVDGAVVVGSLLLVGTLLCPLLLRPPFRRMGAFGVVVFLVSLLPVSQIIPIVTMMNDRYLYFPMLGVAVFVAAVLDGLDWPVRRAALVVCAAVSVVFAVGSYRRTGVWHDSVSLWANAAQEQPHSYMTWRMLGHSYFMGGDNRQAVANYSKAIELYDKDPLLYYDAAVSLQEMGENGRAMEYYERSLKFDDSHVDSMYRLGMLYVKSRRYGEARKVLLRAASVSPTSWHVYLALGHVAYLLNDLQGAMASYRRSAQLNDASPHPWNMLGLVEERLGRHDLGEEYLRRAVARGGRPADNYLNRARLEGIGGHGREARAYLRMALGGGLEDPQAVLRDPDLRSVLPSSGFPELSERR